MILATLSRLTLLNAREMRAHWARSLASVAVVAVSAALIVAVLGISGSITGSIDRLAASIGGDAALEVSGVTDSGFDEALFDDITGLPDVVAAVPLLRMQTSANSGRALLLGVDRNISALHSDLQTAISDQLRTAPTPSGPNAVIVGAGVSAAQGSQVDVAAGRATAAAVVDGPAARRVNGGRFVVAPLALAQQITGREQRLDSILVYTRPGASLEQVRTELTKALGGRAIVATPGFRAAQASSSFAILAAITLLAASVSLVVSAFLTYNAMSIAIAQRRPLISIMRALGGRRRTIIVDLLGEAALLGLVGAVIGSVCGILIGRIAIGRLPSTLVASLDAHLEYVLAPYVVPAAIGPCVVATVLAAVVAARQVHAVAPIEAMTPVAASSLPAGSPKSRISAGITGIILVAVTVALTNADLGRVAVASIALAFIGAGAICFAFSGFLIKAAAVMARLFGAAGELGAAGIERAPRRMWVALMTVMTAVLTTVAVSGATRNAVDSTVASFSSVADADVWVSATPATDYPTAPLLPSDAQARVSEVPGVQQVVPGQMAFVTVGDTRVIMMGIADGSHRDIVKSLSESQRDALLSGQGVVLSRDLGRTLKISPGDAITLQTPTGERRLPVLALVPYFSGLTGTVAISLANMQDWFDRLGATDLEITATPGADPHAVLAAIRNTLPPDVFVYSGHDALVGVSSALDQVIAVITIIASIVVAVSAVTLLNTLMLSVLDRRRELGVLRASGATRRFTTNAILAEAAGIGIVGAMVGVILGVAMQYVIAVALTHVLNISVSFRAHPAMIAIAAGALLICLLGALLPAIRAARLNIVAAIAVD